MATKSTLPTLEGAVDLRQGLIDATGIDINACPTTESLSAAMLEHGLKFKPRAARGKLIDGLFG